MAELIERRNRIKLNTPHLATASGSIASFQTDMRAGLEEIKIHFNPQQAAGTPSPVNQIPIYGWTGCDLHRDGKNLFGGTLGELFPLHIEKDTYVCASSSAERTAGGQCRYYRADGTQIDYWSLSSTDQSLDRKYKAFRLLEDAYYFKFENTENTNFQIEIGNALTAYEPYKGNQIPVSWSSAGTIYGGYANPLTGEGLATVAYRRFTGASDEEWSGSSGVRQVYACRWNEVRRAQIGGNYVIACNMSIPDNSNGQEPAYGYIRNNDSAFNIRTHLFNEDVSQAQLKAYLASNPLEVVCPLITPIPFSFTPVSPIKSLVGQNNVWSSANGNVDVKYWKH